MSKTFTIYSLDGVGYPDTLLPCTGDPQPAELTGLTDELAAINHHILYNRITTTPYTPGVYRILVVFDNSDGTYVQKTYGTMILAPTATADYAVTVDNATKTVTVGVKNAYAADSALTHDFIEWMLSAESCSIGGASVNTETYLAKLQARSTFTKYTSTTSQETIDTTPTRVLGCFLPADDTLWEDNAAVNSKTFTVNGVNVNLKFKQDDEAVRIMRDALIMYQAGAVRGQRKSVITNGTDIAAYCYGKRENNMDYLRVAVRSGHTGDNLVDAMGGIGLKTMLVGYCDAVYVKVSTTTTFSGSKINLYDSSNKRYYAYSSTTEKLSLLSVINNILKGMGMSTVSILGTNKLSKYIGSTGYIKYYNVGNLNGLRYSSPMKFSFNNYTDSEDAHHTLSETTTANGTYVAYNASAAGNTGAVFSKANLDYMAKNEIIRVVATPSAGYVLDSIKIVDGSGNTLTTADANGDIVMPASNGTLKVTFKPAS